MCLTITAKVFRKQEISFKVSHLQYTGQKTIGSGYDEVQGSEQWEIKGQMRVFL
jgi:hypothetical protein